MTFLHGAVNGHLVARNHAQPVPDLHLVERNHMVTPRGDLPRRGRRKVQQGLDGGACAAAGPELEHLAEQHQDHDHRRGFKVDGDLAHMLHREGEQIRRQHRYGAEDECRTNADGDQREHVQVP